MSKATYRDAGVDIEAGNRAVELMKGAVKATYGREVLAGIGAFGGLFDAAALKGMASPVLVASTDGVGTKTKIAAALGRYDTIGHDIVGHCVNDILVQGARPLFFLDYVAFNKIIPERVAAIVTGIAEACKSVGCALLGGETAEMPGMYQGEDYDLAGFCVGIVEEERILDGSRTAAGDVVIGLASSGPHSNGYSLIRRLLAGADATTRVGDALLYDQLLAPTRIYVKPLLALIDELPVHGLAHITGGGLIDNIPRVLPPGLEVRLDRRAWALPPVFEWLRAAGNLGELELHRTFNCGIGMTMCVPATAAERALARLVELGERPFVIGEVRKGSGGVVLSP